jgi:N-acetylglucosaminyl-diphospho-decaprenol L-rhamnosyltransferase
VRDRPSPSPTAARLSVVIVSWNGAADLGACLSSLRGADREIVVVDNGSTDTSRDVVRVVAPDAAWLPNDANLGFARAANRGLATARGRYVLFLNPDARATDAAIDAAIAVLEARSAVGLVSVAMRDEAGALVPTVEPFFSLQALLSRRANERATAPLGAEPIEVDWCHGAFLLGRRDELAALGGFDERFFLYAEDMDLCRRVHESGRSVVYLPWVSVVHRGNASGAVLLGELRPAAIFASQLLFYAKHHGRIATIALRVAAGAYFGLHALLARARGTAVSPRDGALLRVAVGGPAAAPLPVLASVGQRSASSAGRAADAMRPAR